VRKYLKPFKNVTLQGPQISTCIKAKAHEEWDTLEGKDYFFYLELWQVWHTSCLLVEKKVKLF